MTAETGEHPGTVEHLTPTAARIELPLPLDGLPFVNAYAVLGSNSVTLIDPGWSTAESESALRAALDVLGCSTHDIRQFVATHSHPDHYTQAVKWQREYGVPVLLGSGEKQTVDAWEGLVGRFPRQAERLLRAGAPELSRTIQQLELEPYEVEMAFGEPAGWLEDQQVIDCDGPSLRVHATPGHTRGHVVFELVEGGHLFTGDHILPRVTPSTGFEMEPQRYPLRSYLPSLELFARGLDGPMLPAHGPCTNSTSLRAAELLAHHAERFDHVRDRLASGHSTAYEIARAMTWTRRENKLSELEVVHAMTAVLEVLAHLDVLALDGEVSVVEADGVAHFTASGP